MEASMIPFPIPHTFYFATFCFFLLQPFLNVVSREGIEPSELVYKPLESFQGKGIARDFAEARFCHYDSRRKGFLTPVERFSLYFV